MGNNHHTGLKNGTGLPAAYRIKKLDRQLLLQEADSKFCLGGIAERVSDGRRFRFTSIAASAVSKSALQRFETLRKRTDNDQHDGDKQSKFLLSPAEWGTHAGAIFEIYAKDSPLEILLPKPGQDECKKDEVVRILAIAENILEGLSYLHGQHVLHRQINASSVRQVDGQYLLCLPDLLSYVAANELPEREAIKFALHASPELAGTIDHDLSAPSDLYSFGVLLFQLLSGKLPFEGSNVNSLLLKHVTCTPPWQILGETPPILIQLLERLLKKEPGDRYQTAAGVLNDIREIRTALISNESAWNVVLGRVDKRDHIVEPAFVGRKLELAQVQEGIRKSLAGEHVFVSVNAPSGHGKTRFVRTVISNANQIGFTSFFSAAKNQVGSRPGAPIIELAEQVAADSTLLDRIKDKLIPYQEELVHALPFLAEAFNWKKTSSCISGPEELGQRRVAKALCEFLRVLGSPEFPVIIWIDDLQWADPQTMEVLIELGNSSSPYAVVGISYRSENESEIQGFLDNFGSRLPVELGPLNQQGVAELVQSMAGVLPESVICEIFRLSEGSPFMARAVLQGMVESEAVYPKDGEWEIDKEKFLHLQASDDAAAILLNRIEELPIEELNVLSAASVVGKEFDSETVAALLDMEPEQVKGCLNQLRRQKLIWLRPDGQCAFIHDQILETTASRLNERQRQLLHFKLASYFESTDVEKKHEIAFHFNAAGDPSRGLVYAVQAAEEARRRYSLESATELFLIAERGIENRSDIDDKKLQKFKFQIFAGQADSLILLGQYANAEKYLELTNKCADSSEEKAWTNTKQGELCFKRGDKAKSLSYFESGLEQLNCKVPKSMFHLLPCLCWELMVQVSHSIFPRIFVHRNPEQPPKNQRLILQLYSRLAHAYWYSSTPPRVLWVHLRGMNVAERYQPSLELAQAYSDHGPALSLIPWVSRGKKYVTKSLEMRRDLKSTWGQGQSAGFKALAMFAASRFDECIENARIAEQILERTGDQWETNIARYHLAASQYHLGHSKESVAACKTIYSSSLAVGDFQSTGNILEVWARASDGDVPVNLIANEKARDVVDFQRDCQLLLADGICRLKRKDYLGAARCFKDGIEICKKKGIINAYTSPNYTWYVKALRLGLESNHQTTPSEFRQAKAHLLAQAKKAIWVAKRFQNELSLAYHEYGLVLNYFGKIAKAKKMLSTGMKHARLKQTQGENLRLRESYCRLGQVNNWKNWANYMDYQDSGVDVATQEASASLVDQFDTLLNSGRKILSGDSNQEVFEKTIEASTKLLRGQRVFILDSQIDDLGVEADCDYSIELVRQTLSKKRTCTQVFPSRSNQERQKCLAGSHLCSPIKMGQAIAGVLYAKNELVSNYFGPEAIRIADYLANAAGSALDTIDGYQKLEELNQFLESKVTERTSALESRTRILERTAAELQLTQFRLQVAHDEAQRANDAKSEFLARMSHEIRTPLSAIQGFTDLILRGTISEPDECREKLKTVHSSSQHLVRLINELLDLSKVEADKLELELIDFSPAQVVFDTFESLQSKSQQQKIDFELNFTSAIPEQMTSDPTRIKQIITNLLGNALKFSPNGTVHLDVSTTSEKDDLQLQFKIVDSGIGMTEDQLEKVFEPFVQADSSTTRKYGGSGLGLAITKRLVELLGGTLAVESQTGEGSTFTVAIPIENSSDIRFITSKQAKSVAAKSNESMSYSADLTGVRILVADDSEINHELLACILRDTNVNLTQTMDGQEAVDAVANEPEFDLVLMDIQMPILDGLSATKQLRNAGFNNPVIALTANKMKGDEEEYLSAGFNAYVSKPIDIRLLMETICNFLHRPLIQTNDHDKEIGVGSSGTEEPSDVVYQNAPWYGELNEDPELRRLTIKFVNNTLERDMPTLDEAITIQDHETIASVVHRLKGTSGTVQLHQLCKAFQKLESHNRECDWEEVGREFSHIGELIEFQPAVVMS